MKERDIWNEAVQESLEVLPSLLWELTTDRIEIWGVVGNAAKSMQKVSLIDRKTLIRHIGEADIGAVSPVYVPFDFLLKHWVF